MVGQALRRLLPLLVVGALLVTAAIAASLSSVGLHQIPVRSDSAGPTPTSLASASPSPSPRPSSSAHEHSLVAIPHWLKVVVLAVIAAIVAGLIIAIIAYAIRNAYESRTRVTVRARGIQTKVNRREDVLATVDATMEDLARDDGDPRAAVILCWVRLEEIAATAGIERAAGDSPTDLVTRLLRTHLISPAVLDSLAGLYRIARYSPHHIPPSMRDEAHTALGRLRAELALSRTAPTPGDTQLAVPTGGRPRPRHGGNH